MSLLLLLLLSIIYVTVESVSLVMESKSFNNGQRNNHDCPQWTLPKDNNSCQCGDDLNGIVKCNPQTLDIEVVVCHCMTFSDIYNTTVVGYCLYSCNFMRHTYLTTKGSCNPNVHLNRTGQLCAQCTNGYSPSVYSHNMACAKCDNYKLNWLKYIAVAFLPLTIFYIIFVLFRITATAPSLNAYILISQIVAAPFQLRWVSVHLNSSTLNKVGFSAFATVYSIWNLDFFRSVYSPFCLHPNMSTLQTFALEYIISVYPLCLIFITYVCVKLHDRYSVIVRLWRPFYRCFMHLRNKWDIRNNLIGAFATFIILSYVKIINTSFDILTPTSLYDVHGNKLPKSFLYYDGSYEYFGIDHLPYACLALFFLLVFIVLPLVLLCLYPCRCFHKFFLNHCKFRYRQPLVFFMETFQACYKLKPYDCRYFSALYLLLRIINLAIFSITTSPFYYFLSGALFSGASLLVAIVRPYKQQAWNVFDAVAFLLVAINAIAIPAISFVVPLDPEHVHQMWFAYFGYSQLFLLPLYGAGLVVYAIIPKHVWTVLKGYSQCCHRNASETAEVRPYRLDHPNEFPPLIPDSEREKRTGYLTETVVGVHLK